MKRAMHSAACEDTQVAIEDHLIVGSMQQRRFASQTSSAPRLQNIAIGTGEPPGPGPGPPPPPPVPWLLPQPNAPDAASTTDTTTIERRKKVMPKGRPGRARRTTRPAAPPATIADN